MAALAKRRDSHITHASTGKSGVALFSHLRPSSDPIDPARVHWAVRNVGMQMQRLIITGGNARCRETLLACVTYLKEYSPLANLAINRDLMQNIETFGAYLDACRPLCFGMANALKDLKSKVEKLNPNVTAEKACRWLITKIQIFIRERIDVAVENIAQRASSIIKSGEVILTYGRSSAVEAALLHLRSARKDFKVIVVDSRPYLEGRTLLQQLLAAGIPCSYVMLSSIAYIIPEATRVFVGCSGLLANGSLMNRAGTALICSIANLHNKPVLVLAETYKFSERVQLDSICYNELEEEASFIENTAMYPGDTRISPTLTDGSSAKNVVPLSVRFDITPAKFIDMLITEVGCIPSTSVPVILREFQAGTDDTEVDLDSLTEQ